MRSATTVFVLVLTTVTALAACAPAPSPTPTPVSPTTTPILPTSTPPPTPTFTPIPTPTATPTPTPTPLPLILSSTAFEPGGVIPERYGYLREDTSPALAWQNLPAGAQSLALLVDDMDAPFTHWVIYNVPPTVGGLPEGVIEQPQLPDGTLQGLNSNQVLGYIGPFPPPGETHRYAFTLYALDAPLELESGATREQVSRAMEGHILATGELTGAYVGVAP